MSPSVNRSVTLPSLEHSFARFVELAAHGWRDDLATGANLSTVIAGESH
jgi:hypothetical protein